MTEIAAYKLRLAEAIKADWQATLKELEEEPDGETYTSRDILLCCSNVHLTILRLMGFAIHKTDELVKITPGERSGSVD